MGVQPRELRAQPLSAGWRAGAALLALLAAAPAGAADPADPEPAFSYERPESLPSDEELVAMGAVIGEVRLDRQQIFDTSQPEEDKALYRLANRLHPLTRPSVITSQLLFASGDPYDPRLLAESERILRGNGFLFDALVVPVAYENGEVDVLVRTRDVWTLEPSLSLSRSGGENRTLLGVEDQNFLGTGATIALEFESDVDRDSRRITYSDRQLGRNWISADLSYSDNTDGSTQALSVWRPFYALDTRWAGGFTGFSDDREESLYELGDEVVDYRHEEQLLHAWYGWSPGLRGGWTRRWRAGVIYDDNVFGPPDDLVRAGPVPEDRKLVYPYIGVEIIEDRYTETMNHDQIGRTEDFFLGTRLSARIGWSDESFGADRDAWLVSGAASRGYGTPAERMLLLDARASARLESGEVENGLVRGSIRYYHKQSEKRLFFMTLHGAVSENLDLDNPLQLGGDRGLRGYPIRYQTGEASAVFTIEQRYFTDWYPWRFFRVGGAVFADIGRTWGDNPVGGGSLGLLKDAGFGLRLAPTRGGTEKVIHIDVAFPLDGDDSLDTVQISVEGKRSF
ncbi:MAG TPA: hypothetical protein VFF18_14060 [Woeseiaceae bacterium]|nr:hypothetical protein [Woeseiaceae bacterium]